MDFGVDIGYEGPDGAPGMDHVAVMEAMGALGRRVKEPGDIQAALEWAVSTSEERGVPALVEIYTERGVDASMGLALDAINEYEPVVDGDTQRAGQVVGGVPERD